MLKNINRQMSISAVSEFEDGKGEKVPVLTFYSAIQSDGKPSFNQAVNDVNLYETNMESADADFKEFKNMVMQAAKSYSETK